MKRIYLNLHPELSRIYTIFIIITSLLVSVSAQTSDDREEERRRNQVLVEQNRKAQKEKNDREARLKNLKEEFAKDWKKLNINRFNLSPEDKKYLSPSENDISNNKDLLSLKDAEIIKLLNYDNCFDDQIFALDDNCRLNIPGFGMYYSFRSKKYVFRDLADIYLYKNLLVSNGFFTQGIFVNLGKVKFEDITLKTDGVTFLTDFVAATTINEAKKQSEQIQNVIQKNNFSYSQKVEVKNECVYALRSIAYRSKNKVHSLDKRRDLILLFKIVNLEKDGNITLIWRILQNEESPKLKNTK